MTGRGVEEATLLGWIAAELGRAEVRSSDRWLEDLGAESMDLVGVLGALEDRWGVEIDELDLAEMATVGDLVRRVRGGHSAGREPE